MERARQIYHAKHFAINGHCAQCAHLFDNYADSQSSHLLIDTTNDEFPIVALREDGNEYSRSIRLMFKELSLLIPENGKMQCTYQKLDDMYARSMTSLRGFERRLGASFKEYFDKVREGLALAKDVIACEENEAFQMLEQAK